MLKKIIKLTVVALLWLMVGTKTVQAEERTILIFDIKQNSVLPENFRYSSTLHAAGGAQFTQEQLKKIIDILGKSAVIIDLRQESHGFVNGLPISWYGPQDWANAKLSDAQINSEEFEQLSSLSKDTTITINEIVNKDEQDFVVDSKKISVKISDIRSEQELVENFGLHYQRFFITDHRAPNDLEVNRFVKFIKILSPDTSLYFHCHAGIGRTSTFMVMYDIMRNAKRMSLDEIIKRQVSLGGKDLQELKSSKAYKIPYQLQRYHFIQQFYEYVRTNQDDFATSWFEWKKSHKN